MASALTNADYVRIQVYCYDNVTFQVAINTWYASVSGITGAPTDLSLAQALVTATCGLWTHCLASTAQFVGVAVTRWNAGPPRPAVQFATASGLASLGIAANGGPLPELTAGLVIGEGPYAQKGQRARLYIPFPGTAHLTITGQMTGTYQLYLGSIATYVYQQGPTGNVTGTVTLSPYIHHRAQPSRNSKSKRHPSLVLPGTPEAWYLIVGSYYSVVWARQKRRGPRGRTNVFPTL